MKRRQAERALLAKEKVSRVQQQRKELEYKHKQAAKKTQEWFKRIELIDVRMECCVCRVGSADVVDACPSQEMHRAGQIERSAAKHRALIKKHEFERENPILRKVTPVRPSSTVQAFTTAQHAY